jgi:hypothetical protein
LDLLGQELRKQHQLHLSDLLVLLILLDQLDRELQKPHQSRRLGLLLQQDLLILSDH